MAQLRQEEQVSLYADHDVNDELVDKINGYGFSIKIAPKRGYGRQPDDVHIGEANRQQRCLIAQDKDYLANPEYRGKTRYGLIIVSAKHWGEEDTINDIAHNCKSMLNWGKEFFKRQAVFRIGVDSIRAEYLTKSGELCRKEFRYRNGELESRELTD